MSKRGKGGGESGSGKGGRSAKSPSGGAGAGGDPSKRSSDGHGSPTSPSGPPGVSGLAVAHGVNLKVVKGCDFLGLAPAASTVLVNVYLLSPTELVHRVTLVRSLNVEWGGLDGSCEASDCSKFASELQSFSNEAKWRRRPLTSVPWVASYSEADNGYVWDAGISFSATAGDVVLIEFTSPGAPGFTSSVVVLPEWYVSPTGGLASSFYAAAAADAAGTELCGRIGWGRDHPIPHFHWGFADVLHTDVAHVGSRPSYSNSRVSVAVTCADLGEELKMPGSATKRPSVTAVPTGEATVVVTSPGARPPHTPLADTLARSLQRMSLESPGASPGSSGRLFSPTPPAAPPTPSHPVEIRVKPHQHSKYCNRVREVCTANGAFREGNTLLCTVAPSVTAGVPADQVQIIWYRSTVSTGRPDGRDAVARHSDVAVTVDSPAGPTTVSHDAVVATPITSVADGLEYVPVTKLPYAGEIPEIPSINNIAKVTNLLVCESLAAAASLHCTESPMDSSFAALMIDLKQAQEATTQHDKYFLTLKDVGYKYLVGVHVPDRPVMLSNPVGPIEAAPPRAREVWITGDAVVGDFLVAHIYYFGGFEGPCEFVWIRVGVDGGRDEFDRGAALPSRSFSEDIEAIEADPRIYILTEADEGCQFKVTVTPVRSDGSKGAPSTSKLTKAIAPEPK